MVLAEQNAFHISVLFHQCCILIFILMYYCYQKVKPGLTGNCQKGSALRVIGQDLKENYRHVFFAFPKEITSSTD
jgi:hypothetical protein